MWQIIHSKIPPFPPVTWLCGYVVTQEDSPTSTCYAVMHLCSYSYMVRFPHLHLLCSYPAMQKDSLTSTCYTDMWLISKFPPPPPVMWLSGKIPPPPPVMWLCGNIPPPPPVMQLQLHSYMVMQDSPPPPTMQLSGYTAMQWWSYAVKFHASSRYGVTQLHVKIPQPLPVTWLCGKIP